MSDLSHLLEVYERYIDARNILLDELQLKGRSNRDPLPEFSERLVAALVEGDLADSRVQPGWDVQGTDGEKIQVKCLSNSTDEWVNGITIEVNRLMDSYAMVIFKALLPQAVIFFPARNLAAVGNALGKLHGNLDSTLQFTRANYRQILSNPSWFKGLGVRVYLPPDWALQ